LFEEDLLRIDKEYFGMRYPRVVAFFGPDGAGKSTQAELLVTDLRGRGFKVKRAWVRSVHTFAYLLWVLMYRLNLCHDESGMPTKMRVGFAVSYLSEDSYGAVSPITMNPPILRGRVSRFVWSIIEILSVIPVVVLQVYLPLMLGRVVVAERFVVDSVASIAYFLDDESFPGSLRAKFLLRLTPRGTVFVFVDAGYEAILARRGKFAGPRYYTDFHRRLYNRLALEIGAFRVDTSGNSVPDVHKKILNFASR
jgi:thymidylate kinase